MARELGGFGRLVAPVDARDKRFLMRGAMPQMRQKVGVPLPRVMSYHEPPDRLNQGNTPKCVSFSGKGFILAAPIMKDPGYDTDNIYTLCQRNDEWPGEDYDGTSVRALMTVLKMKKWISSYVWGQTVDEALTWMNGGYGTLIIGTNWYASMDAVDPNGFIKEPSSTDTPIGGHAYRVNWFDRKRDGFLIVNSWGRDWGMADPHHAGQLAGMAYMRRVLLERLLKEDGEITAPTQVKLTAVVS